VAGIGTPGAGSKGRKRFGQNDSQIKRKWEAGNSGKLISNSTGIAAGRPDSGSMDIQRLPPVQSGFGQ
jgi:hypothetical protein